MHGGIKKEAVSLKQLLLNQREKTSYTQNNFSCGGVAPASLMYTVVWPR